MKRKLLSWFNSEVSRVEFYIIIAILVSMLAIQLAELDRATTTLENCLEILPFGYEENMRWLEFDKTIVKPDLSNREGSEK